MLEQSARQSFLLKPTFHHRRAASTHPHPSYLTATRHTTSSPAQPTTSSRNLPARSPTHAPTNGLPALPSLHAAQTTHPSRPHTHRPPPPHTPTWPVPSPPAAPGSQGAQRLFLQVWELYGKDIPPKRTNFMSQLFSTEKFYESTFFDRKIS